MTSEGDRAWRGWYDSERGENCSFGSPGSDGVARCWPLQTLQARYYTDETCTTAVASASSLTCEGVAPKYISHYEVEGCIGSTRIHEIGAVVATPTQLYDRALDGTCVADPQVPIEDTYYLLGPEVPPTDFVASEPLTDAGPSRVRAFGSSGIDGTRAVAGWLDADTMKMCGFLPAEDGSVRCFPQGFLYTAVYSSDAACTSPVLQRTVTECTTGEPAAIANAPVEPECPYAHSAFQRGAPLTTVYSGDATACMAAPPEAYTQQEFFERGPALPAATFAAVDYVTVDSDPGRVKPVYGTTEDGGCWFDGWYDSELDARCSFDQAADGRHYCLPDSDEYLTVLETFSDASCTQPMAIAVYNACGAVPLPAWVRIDSWTGCEATYEVRKVNGTLAGSAAPPLWIEAGDSCVSYTPNAESNYLTLSEIYEPSAFLPAELSAE